MALLSCGARLLKYSLFGFNLVFFIAGCICVGAGIFLMADEHAIDKVIEATETQGSSLYNKPLAVYNLGVLMLVGGVIILVISFLGCCGAVKEWRPLLVLYAVCLMIILSLEIGAAVYAIANRMNLELKIKGTLLDTLRHYAGSEKEKSAVRKAWDESMTKGCYDKLKEGLEEKLSVVIGVGVAVGLIQLVGIIVALCLCNSITYAPES